MLQEKVALRTFAAVYTFVVPQHVLNLVQARRTVPTMLAAVAANNFHSQTPRHDLALVAVFEAHVLISRTGVMFQLPPLMSALAVDVYYGATGPRVRVQCGKGIVDGQAAQRIQDIISSVHVG